MKKLALVAAIAATTNLYALEAMTDESLSAATGQDGITIVMETPDGLTIDALYIHDKDGLDSVTAGLTGDAGAITLGTLGTADDMEISTTGPTTITIDADGGSDDGDLIEGASLNVNLNIAAMEITTGSIGVAVSERAATVGGIDNYTSGGVTAGSTVKILDSLTINLGNTNVNVQLGTVHQADGALVKLSGTVTGGVEISGFRLNGTDVTHAGPPIVTHLAGALSIGNIVMRTAGNADLVLSADINIDKDGLSFVHTGAAFDIMLENVKLGDVDLATANHNIGDVEILGLDASGATIHVRGH